MIAQASARCAAGAIADAAAPADCTEAALGQVVCRGCSCLHVL